VRLNIRTYGVDHELSYPDAVPYQALAYPAIRAILRKLLLGPDDVFVDIGCGKGRVVCCAGRYPIRHAVGIEVNTRLAAIARANVKRLRGRKAPIEILDTPAQDADYSTGTVFFLFNPFGESTCRAVAETLAAATAGRDVPARIAYVLPNHLEAFEASDFEPYETWPPRPELLLDYPTVFLRRRRRSSTAALEAATARAARSLPFPFPSASGSAKSMPSRRDSRSNER
jgi:SAM-dependent methyltransferase